MEFALKFKIFCAADGAHHGTDGFERAVTSVMGLGLDTETLRSASKVVHRTGVEMGDVRARYVLGSQVRAIREAVRRVEAGATAG